MGRPGPWEKEYPEAWIADLGHHPVEIEGAWHRLCNWMVVKDVGGEFDMTLDQYARLLGVDPPEAERLLRYIQKEKIGDVIFRNDRVMVVSRRLKREAKERELNRNRVAKSRTKQACNGDVMAVCGPRIKNKNKNKNKNKTPLLFPPSQDEVNEVDDPDQPSDKKNAAKDLEEIAESIYQEYPRKAAKADTLKSISRLLKSGRTEEELRCSVRHYKAECERRGTEREYVIQSNNFFGRKGRWEEWLNPTPAANENQNGSSPDGIPDSVKTALTIEPEDE